MLADTDSLEFVIGASPLGAKREDELDLATAPGYQLFFSCFLGDVRLRVNGVDFSTRFGWVATLSLAIGLGARIGDLPRTPRQRLEFQESEDWISLALDRDTVSVSASYAKGVGTIPYERLRHLSRDALAGLVTRLVAEYPALKQNAALRTQLDPILGAGPVESLLGPVSSPG